MEARAASVSLFHARLRPRGGDRSAAAAAAWAVVEVPRHALVKLSAACFAEEKEEEDGEEGAGARRRRRRRQRQNGNGGGGDGGVFIRLVTQGGDETPVTLGVLRHGTTDNLQLDLVLTENFALCAVGGELPVAVTGTRVQMAATPLSAAAAAAAAAVPAVRHKPAFVQKVAAGAALDSSSSSSSSSDSDASDTADLNPGRAPTSKRKAAAAVDHANAGKRARTHGSRSSSSSSGDSSSSSSSSSGGGGSSSDSDSDDDNAGHSKPLPIEQQLHRALLSMSRHRTGVALGDLAAKYLETYKRPLKEAAGGQKISKFVRKHPRLFKADVAGGKVASVPSSNSR